MSTSRKTDHLTIDFRTEKMPDWVREVIETQMAIEDEDAKAAGALGFMSRALVLASLPYRHLKDDDGTPEGVPRESFTRRNGDFTLRVIAGYYDRFQKIGGIPFGIYPRLLMSWVTTEAVLKKSPVIELGDSLRTFLREVLDVRSGSGGKRGATTTVSEQMARLFGSLITAHYSGGREKRGFTLRNVLIADRVNLDPIDQARLDGTDEGDGRLWTPQAPREAGQWRSQVHLSHAFFHECVSSPVPIDLRAYKALRGSALSMDVYTWLTYRMSYTRRPTRPIPWESLLMQFGSTVDTTDMGQATRNFRKAFLHALKLVLVVYPQANIHVRDNGLVLLPSRPQVAPVSLQPELF